MQKYSVFNKTMLKNDETNKLYIIFFHYFIASAHTGEPLDEYPDISGITTARVCFIYYILI